MTAAAPLIRYYPLLGIYFTVYFDNIGIVYRGSCPESRRFFITAQSILYCCLSIGLQKTGSADQLICDYYHLRCGYNCCRDIISGNAGVCTQQTQLQIEKVHYIPGIFAMLFSGGLVPSYIIKTKYLHLNDTIWVYILPSIISTWNLIVLRSNFRSVPSSLIESAKVDGANEWRICFQIVYPLSVPSLAAIGFLQFVGKWNDWFTASIYVRKPNLYSLQFLLQRILRDM